jgi:DNA-directed RNA polymerase specialized sigma24 family protein
MLIRIRNGACMAGEARSNDAVSVSPVDHRGRPISPLVLNAAEEIRRRAIQHAEKFLVDPAVAANLLEESAAAVSRALGGPAGPPRPVRDLEAYLFRAFLRRLNRTKKRLSPACSAEFRALCQSSTDPRKAFELKILVDEFLMRCDPVTRDVFYRRVEGRSWSEIGWAYRISSHAAQSKFSQKLQRVRKKLGLR